MGAVGSVSELWVKPASGVPSAGPQVGLSLVNYFSAAETGRAIRAVADTATGVELRVACLDNSTDDREFDRLKAVVQDVGPQVVLIRSTENVGYGRGHNAATEALLHRGSNVLIIANSDVELRIGALRGVYDYVSRRPRAIYGATTATRHLVYTGMSVFNPWTSRTRPFKAGVNRRGGILYPGGHFLCVEASTWAELGGFSPLFFLYYEEVDLAVRAASAGIRVGVIPGIVVAHSEGLTTGAGMDGAKSQTTFYHSIRSSLILTRQHFSARLPTVLASRLGYALLHASRDPSRGRVAARAIFDAMRCPLSWSQELP